MTDGTHKTIGELTENGLSLIKEAVDGNAPSRVFGLFSGGHDSLCATHLAMQSGVIEAVVHIDTGIGVQATKDYVKSVCDKYDWPLWIIQAKEDCGQDYEQLVMDYGFPGPDHHRKMYNRLKERCINYLERRYREYTIKPRRRIPLGFISGVRSAESSRRMKNVDRIQLEQHRLWIAPCHDWDKNDQARYIEHHQLPLNPVKVQMCMSGECLCGAFASKGELAEWIACFPDDPGIQNLVRIRNKVVKKHPWDWDDPGPPKSLLKERRGQNALFDHHPKFEEIQMLCTNCNWRHEQGDISQKQDVSRSGKLEGQENDE